MSNFLLDIQGILLLLKSIGVSFAVGFFATLNGGIFSFFITKTTLDKKNFIRLFYLLPLFLSPYIIAVAWIDLLIFFNISPKILFNYFGVIFILTLIYSPLSMLIVSYGLNNISRSLEEAAIIIAPYSYVIKKIFIPLLRPHLFSSFILVFVLSLSEFSVPSFLGVKVFTTEIFTQFAAFYNYELAIKQSIILLGTSLFFLLLQAKQLSRASFLSITMKSSNKIRLLDYKKNNYLIKFSLWLYLFFSVGFPLFILFIQSFAKGTDFMKKAFFLLLPTVSNSIGYSCLGALILTCLGFIIGYLSENFRLTILDLLLFFTFALPSTVLGIGLIKIFNKPSLSVLYSSGFMIILVYVFKFLFISQKIISNSIKQHSKSFEESAKILGANPLKTLFYINIPLNFKAIFASFTISFILCLSELGGTILVYPPGTSLMPIKVFTIMANAPQTLASSMCLWVLFFTLLAVSSLFLAKIITEKVVRNFGWQL